MIRIIWLTIFSLFLLGNAGFAAENHQVEELFFKANQAYKQGQFQDAIIAYRQLIESGHSNGHLYYNLGNCYMRLGQVGAAILSYERARLLLAEAVAQLLDLEPVEHEPGRVS